MCGFDPVLEGEPSPGCSDLKILSPYNLGRAYQVSTKRGEPYSTIAINCDTDAAKPGLASCVLAPLGKRCLIREPTYGGVFRTTAANARRRLMSRELIASPRFNGQKV